MPGCTIDLSWLPCARWRPSALPATVGLLLATVGLLCGAGMARASLPDGRAWEMVSPLEKNGGGISNLDDISSGGVLQAAADGERITYVSLASFGVPQGAPIGSQYVSTRNPTQGWLTQNISTPMNDQAYVFGSTGTPYRAFSTELSSGLLAGGERGGSNHSERPVESPPLTPGAPAGYENYYLSGVPGGALQPLLTQAPSLPPNAFSLEYLGATPDLAHVILKSPTALGAGAIEGEGFNLYEWQAATGLFQPVNILPGGSTSEPENVMHLGGGEDVTERAISEDGSRVVWSANTGLYVRVGIGTLTGTPATEHAQTLQVNAPTGGGEYLTASSDDKKIFFKDPNPLTAESSSEGRDLYLFEPEADRLVDLTVNHVDPGGAEVLGVLGASADGSYLYFVANGKLATGASQGNCSLGASPPESTCNLYLWHEGWKGPKFIATLAGNDQSGSAFNAFGVAFDWDSSAGVRTARVSRDGTRVVFMSERSITGYDNTVSTGSSCGEEGQELPAQCQEVFMYEASGDEAAPGRLSCLSCNPTGAQPSGPSGIPGGTDFSLLHASYQSRVISEGEGAGRVFFDSADALVPQDTNGAPDVYEYENGQVFLLSDGKNPEGASFVNASENGDDAFFLTSAQLVPQDTDRLVDLYDARAPHNPREAVGFPQPPPPAPCEGEECRPASPPVPVFGSPASATFSGLGNAVAPAPAKAKPKKKVKPKKKTKLKPKKAKRRKKQAKRANRARS